MVYPFLTLPENTEIVYAKACLTDEQRQVKDYIIKVICCNFKAAACSIPASSIAEGYNN